MKHFTTAALAFAIASFACAAAHAQAPAKVPTPEAAARFIDTVLGNGVAKAAKLNDANNFSGGEAAEYARTSACKTVIVSPTGSYGRTVIELDWRTFVATNSFFSASVTDRWGARLLVRTTQMLTENDDISKVNQYSIKQAVGIVVEPGTEELKDRLIRAFEFYGKSCAPQPDGPF